MFNIFTICKAFLWIRLIGGGDGPLIHGPLKHVDLTHHAFVNTLKDEHPPVQQLNEYLEY